MKRLDYLTLALMLAAILVASNASADPFQNETKSFWDQSGHFAGSSSARDNTTSFSDHNGHFAGSAIRNSNGTTSLYDHNGHFTGSVISTSPSPNGRQR